MLFDDAWWDPDDLFIAETEWWARRDRYGKAELLVTEWLTHYVEKVPTPRNRFEQIRVGAQHAAATSPRELGPLARHAPEMWAAAFAEVGGFIEASLIHNEVLPGVAEERLRVTVHDEPLQPPDVAYRIALPEHRERWSWLGAPPEGQTDLPIWQCDDYRRVFALVHRVTYPFDGPRAQTEYSVYDEWILEPGAVRENLR